MDVKDKLSTLQFSIGRYDHYYDTINNKGNVYLTLNAFLLGGILTAYYALADGQCNMWIVHLPIILILLSNMLVTFYSLLALMPHLSKKNKNGNGSLLWFGDASCQTPQVHNQRWNQLSEGKLLDDLCTQNHALACGLDKKFRRLKTATWLLGIEILLIAIVGSIVLK